MIAEYKLYHGALFADVINGATESVSFRSLQAGGRMSNYVINEKVAVQIKYATQRIRPWHFNFPEDSISALRELKVRYLCCYVVLVCRVDGMIALRAEEILDSPTTRASNSFWLRADRKKGQLYRLHGPDGELKRKYKTTIDPILAVLS